MISKLLVVLLGAVLTSTDGVFYKSPALREVSIMPVSGHFSILDDGGESVDIMAMEDENCLLYWYRRIQTPVCLTGECKAVDIGVYWDLTGDFFGLEVYGEHLTKTDHTTFSAADYQKLVDILANDWSVLREYKLEDLTNGPTQAIGEGTGNSPDVTSGATRREIASEAVAHAVYTTYTLWHLVHVGEKAQLANLTVEVLQQGTLTDRILTTANNKLVLFLLELFANARIQQADKLTPLVLKGLRQGSDPNLQSLALRSIPHIALEKRDVQSGLADAYVGAPDELRLRMVNALKGLRYVSDTLYAALEPDVHIENEWFSAKVLQVLKYAPVQSSAVIATARKRLESSNVYVRVMAEEYLKYVGKPGG